MGAGRGTCLGTCITLAVEVEPVGLLAGRLGLLVKVKYSTSGRLRKVAVARGHVVKGTLHRPRAGGTLMAMSGIAGGIGPITTVIGSGSRPLTHGLIGMEVIRFGMHDNHMDIVRMVEYAAGGPPSDLGGSGRKVTETMVDTGEGMTVRMRARGWNHRFRLWPPGMCPDLFPLEDQRSGQPEGACSCGISLFVFSYF